MGEVIMRAGQCGKHRREDCEGCQAAWESNDHRLQAMDAEIAERDALLREAREWLPDDVDAEGLPELIARIDTILNKREGDNATG